MAQEWVKLDDDARSNARALRGAPRAEAPTPRPSSAPAAASPPASRWGQLRRTVRDLHVRLAILLDQPPPRTGRDDRIIRGGHWVGDPTEPRTTPGKGTDRRP